MSVFDPGKRFQRELCTGCGVCLQVCPLSAVRTDPTGLVASFARTCIGCGHCGCYCPSNCFRLEAATDGDKSPPEELLSRIIENRRSLRTYLDKELDENVITSLLSPVGYSPTGHNDQGIQVSVLAGREHVRKRVLIPIVRVLRILDCFRLISLMAGSGRSLLQRLKEGEDLITWGAPCILLFKAPMRNVTGSTDCVIAASLVSVKAETMGIGTLWNGVLKVLAPFLGLGRASAVICVGYPALKKYQNLPEREWKVRKL